MTESVGRRAAIVFHDIDEELEHKIFDFLKTLGQEIRVSINYTQRSEVKISGGRIIQHVPLPSGPKGRDFSG